MITCMCISVVETPKKMITFNPKLTEYGKAELQKSTNYPRQFRLMEGMIGQQARDPV